MKMIQRMTVSYDGCHIIDICRIYVPCRASIHGKVGVCRLGCECVILSIIRSRCLCVYLCVCVSFNNHDGNSGTCFEQVAP